MADARSIINSSKSKQTTDKTQQFPLSMGPIYSQFTLVKYSRDNPKTKAAAATIEADILLPLPFNLKEQYSINYSGSELSYVEGGLQAYQNIMDSGTSLTNLDSTTRKTVEEFVQAFARSSFGDSKLVRSVDRATGMVVNPHLVNIFQNVALRTHTFVWNLSPTSPDEAVILRNIIHTFRERMHPDLRSEFILGFPDEVYVTMHGSSFLYPVFKSVIQDVQIDYTDGRPNAWFSDGAPVTITLSITLQEVETLTREDFTGQQAQVTGVQTAGVTNAE